MQNKILIIYGSLNSVPSPEGAAPAKVIEQTMENLDSNLFNVLSNYNEKLKVTDYNSNIYHFAKSNFLDKVILNVLKLFYNYKKRKKIFITAQDSQLLYFIATCRFVRKNKYRKIIVHVAPGLVTMLNILCPKTEIIFYHHGTSLHRKLTESQWKRLLKYTKNKIIGVNQKAFFRANEVFNFKLEKKDYYTVANGIKITQDTSKQIEDIDESKYNILFSGRVCKEKGVLNLIKAYHLLYKKNSQINLIILGGAGTKRNLKDGKSYIEICKQYCENNNLPVIFKGFQPQGIVYSYIKASDLLVLPTNAALSEEGMSLALLEGMSLGKPLIATDSGGNSEIVIDGDNGYIIPNVDNYEIIMSEKIQEIIDSKELQLKFSENSKILFEKNHTSRAMSLNFLKALKHFNYV